MFEKIVETCKYLLNNFSEASECRSYLDSRLTKESQDIFDFGYYPPQKYLSVLTSIISEDELQNLNLLFSRKIEDSMSSRTMITSYFAEHSLVMPFKDAYGKHVAMVARTLMPEKERQEKNLIKYKNTTPFKKGNHLFGLYENAEEILKENCVYIVEGQFDVIKARENNVKNVVALGNSYMTPSQFALILRYTDNLFLLLDNDEAGKKGRDSINEKFGNHASIQNVYLPIHYKDVDEYFSDGNSQLLLSA